MIIIGVTGNLAAGKSEVAKIFKRRGAKVFDADAAARKAIEKGRPAYKAIIKMFGRGYLTPSGEIDRKKLAWHVFSHPSDLKKLDVLIHPGVIFECFRMIEQYRKKKGTLVLDVPLLFESKMESLADFTIVVYASQAKMIARCKAKGVPPNLTKKILSTQWPLERKKRLADFVIENNGTLADLEKKVLGVIEKINA